MMRGALFLLGFLVVSTPRASAWQDPRIPQPTRTPAAPGDPNIVPNPADPVKDPTNDSKNPSSNRDTTANSLGGDDTSGGLLAPDYTGPAILSRGFALTRPQVAADEKFSYYVGVNASYDSGLLGAYNPGLQTTGISTAGVDLNWGIKGKHYRRKDIFELNYAGHYYDYATNGKYNGQDQSLSLGYTREINPHLSIGFRESAGVYSNNYSVLNSTNLADTSLASATMVVSPNAESFNDQTYYTTTQGSLVWQKSARLSFSVAAANFLVRRNSLQLADSNGYQTNFDMAYRLTKRQTVGIYYTHSAYSFRKQFGSTNADSVGADYTIALSRNMDISVRAGATKLEAQAIGIVVPNPLVQSVLGISSGVEKEYYVGYAPDITVTINRRMRNSSVGASFTKGISPGNGLILTSARESEAVFYSLPTFRRYAMQLGAGRDTLNGYLASTISPGQYSSYYARFSLTHPVMRDLSSVFNLDFRRFSFISANFGQTEYRISIGLRYSPGDRPVKFW